MNTIPTRSYWPADCRSPIRDVTVGGLLRAAAAEHDKRVALIEACPEGLASLTGTGRTDRTWTYGELLAQAETCASWLLERFEPGEAVCIWAPNVPEWVIVQYGAALAGLVLVTANPALREGELRHVLQQSKAVALFHLDSFRGNDMAATAARLRSEVREVVTLTSFLDRLTKVAVVRDLSQVDPAACAQIQFTSGTTGLPKGAMLHHCGLVTNAVFMADRTGQDGEVWVSAMPLFHTAGSGMTVLGCAAKCSTLVLLPFFDPGFMLDEIERRRATFTSGVPTMLSAMLESLRARPRDVSALKLIISGGAPVAPSLHHQVEERFGCVLTTLYGQTELSPSLCATGPEDAARDRAETSGRPLPQVEVRIVAPDTAEVTALDEEGEVQARGHQVMLGYIGQPEATARAVSEDNWLRTGDLGRLDARGYLRITGRLSDMIIRGGENLYPAEIEAALSRHPAVLDVAVFGVPDDHWGEIAAAAVRVRKDASAPGPDELKAHCRSLLSPQKTPTLWFELDAFPLTASGKVQKYVLREQASAGALPTLPRPTDGDAGSIQDNQP